MKETTNMDKKKKLKNWRIAFKEKYGGLDYFMEYSAHQNYDSQKKSYEKGISKGVFDKEIADLLLKQHGKNNEQINDVPEYENQRYHELKELENKIELAISRINNNNGNKREIILKKSPEIITGKLGGLNAFSGRIDPEDPELGYYIAIDTMFIHYIHRISYIGSLLVDPEINYLIKDVEKWKLKNPELYTLFRDVFYHSTLYGFENEKLENISAIINEEIHIHETGNLPLAILITKPVSVIMESMGLFLEGHEYSHIILHYNPKKSIDNKKIERTPEKEFQADELALDLVFNCIQYDYNQAPEKFVALFYCCIGIGILFNIWNVRDRMRDVLKLSPESNLPLAKERMEKIKNLMYSSCEKWELPYSSIMSLDIIDYIFDKLEDYFVNELTKKYNIAYNQKDSLSGNSSNFATLFELGMTFFENNQYDESLKCFSKITIKIEYDNMLKDIIGENIYFIARCYIGFIFIRKAEAMLKNKDKLDKKQQERLDALYNDAIMNLESASRQYDHNGMVYYYLGIAHIYKNNYFKAMLCVKVLKNKNIDPIFAFTLKKGVLEKLSENFNISFENINITDVTRAAKKGDHKEKLKLAIIYECGIDDVPVNMKESIYWYKKAAKKGVVQAQVRLGFFYYERNPKKAIYWSSKAAKMGDSTAQEMLEKMNLKKRSSH
jgi:hypothetical protein